jgi:transcription elongation GreA/GreB family factor
VQEIKLMDSIKTALFAFCTDYVMERINRLKTEIKKTQSSANEETKSSAGDKYETGRAMAQLEIGKNTVQLREAERLLGMLQAIHVDLNSEIIIPGSFVKTNKGDFYISISIGLIKLQQNQYFIIAPDSPIGKLFMGKKVRDVVSWNKIQYQITDIH